MKHVVVPFSRRGVLRLSNPLPRLKLLLSLIAILCSLATSAQIITTVAGTGANTSTGDNGPATVAQVAGPLGIAFDAAGNYYFVEHNSQRVRKVNITTGVITTVAGNGTYGYSGDGGQASSAKLYYPTDVAVDNSGNLYIADYNNHRVRKVDAATSIITTVTGNGTPGYSGDGGQAAAAQLYYPIGVAVDGTGNLFISDRNSSRIRKVDAATGIISTVAGNGTPGYSGDGGQATSAQFYSAWGIEIDATGNLYIADEGNHRVRKVNAATGIITTVGGNGTPGYSGDGGQAAAAQLSYPTAITVDKSGNLYIADRDNYRVRRVDALTGVITTVAGTGIDGYSGDGGPANVAQLSNVYGIAVNNAGNLYIPVYNSNRVRKVNLYSVVLAETKSIACAGDATGELTATVSGGTAPYTYSWSPSSGTGAVAGNLTPGTYTVTVTDANGAVTTATKTVTEAADTQKPTITAPPTVTVSADAGKSTASGVALGSPVVADNCVVAEVKNDAPASFPLGSTTVTWTVTDGAGNQSTATQLVTVRDTEPPVLKLKSFTASLNANGVAVVKAISLDQGTTDNAGKVALSFSVTPVLEHRFTCSDLGDNVVTVYAADEAGNIAFANAVVTITDNTKPTAITQNITVQLNANGTATIVAADVDNGSSDNCGVVEYALDKYTFSCSETGANTVTLTVKDAKGNEASTTATVTVEDKIAPIAIAKSITVKLGANGTATVTAADINNNSTDNCEVADMTVDVTRFDCSNIGANAVALTITDKSGNSSTATATVTVEDNGAPVVLTQNITVELDATGNATITAAQVDNGSSDNCAIETLTLSKTSFDCSNVGENTVTLTVTDKSGNVSTGTAKVTVEDKVAPAALAKDITVQLDVNGNATIVAADVDNGSADACGAVTVSLSKTTFDCSNVGPNTVTLTVTDGNGNVSTTTAVVTVEDKVAPIVVTRNATIQLDGNGTATISAAQLDNGSTDNCAIETITLSKTSFDCSNIGANTVTLTVTDKNGNVSTATATVTVEDKLAPVVVAQNVTIQLDANGTAILTAAQVNNGSSDNCGIASVTVSKTSFDCSNLGANTVTLIITDNSGNSSTATVTITVEDKIAPTITAPAAVVVNVDAGKNTASNVALGTPVAADNCTVTSITNNAPAVYPTGTTTVTWTVTDASGNTSTATQTVTVRRDVVGVAQLATINVPIRTTYANVPLPANATVTYSNGETATVNITWAQGTYNGLIAGSYTLTGQLVLAANTTNTTAKVATVTVVVEPNKVPTALAFSATTFKPEAKMDDEIGTLTTTDPDDNQFVYTLVSGNGDTHNSLFEIRGDKVFLKSNKGLSGQTQFTFRVRSTDPYFNTIEKTFALSKGKYEVAEDKLKIVNAFSPNNDGINDTWFIPELRFYNNVEVEVFDRSGVRVFHTTDPEKGWDGRSQNGQILKGGFFYIVQVKDINLVKKGVVTVLFK